MPILRSNRSLVRGDGSQNFKETFDVMRQECDSFCSGINEPSQNYLGYSPRQITLLHFFDRQGFLAKGCIVIIKWAKDFIERAEKDSFDPSASPSVSLHETTKIVHVDIPIP